MISASTRIIEQSQHLKPRDGDSPLTLISILEALVLLLEKDSRNRRDSAAPDAGHPQSQDRKVLVESFIGLCCLVLIDLRPTRPRGLPRALQSLAQLLPQLLLALQLPRPKASHPSDLLCPSTDLMVQEIKRSYQEWLRILALNAPCWQHTSLFRTRMARRGQCAGPFRTIRMRRPSSRIWKRHARSTRAPLRLPMKCAGWRPPSPATSTP